MTNLHSPPELKIPSRVEPFVQPESHERKVAVEVYAKRYQNRLLHLAASYLGDLHAAEDCVQDVFVVALRKLNPDVPEGAIYQWLVTCTANRAKSVLRSARIRRLTLTDRIDLEARDPSASDCYASLDESGVLAHVLALPVKYREVMILKYYHDFSTSDISSVFKVPENTVKTRLRRAKDMLRDSLVRERGEL